MDKKENKRGGLVITRYTQQSVMLHTSDGIIEVTVSSIMGRKCRLLFRCDKRIPIHRSETATKPQDDNGPAN